jgi:hypothetical protein
MKLLCLLLANFAVILQLNGQAEWKEVKNDEGITVYTKKVEGSDFKAFKSTAVIKADLSSFVALILDVDGLENWGYKLKRTELLERHGDTLQVYFAEAKAPFPYSNRYGIYRNLFKWDANDKQLRIDIQLLNDASYEYEDLMLLTGEGYWEATVLPEGDLSLVFEMHVNPGKGIPGWLSNLFADESPFETMRSVKTELLKQKYKDKRYEFLNN